jgi:hypothetical protein
VGTGSCGELAACAEASGATQSQTDVSQTKTAGALALPRIELSFAFRIAKELLVRSSRDGLLFVRMHLKLKKRVERCSQRKQETAMRRILAALPLSFLPLFFGLSGRAEAQARATVTVRLIDTLSTGSSQTGDSFTATLAAPLVVSDHIVAEKGARVTGQVREVVSSGQLSRPALITLSLNTVQAPSGHLPMQTGDLTIKAGSHATRNLLIIGGAVGAGTAIGGAAGGSKGAAIGAATGAGAGTLGAYLTGKREIVLPSETLLTFHVTSVTISPEEMARLQRAGQGSTQRSTDTQSVVVRRRHHGDDDEDDDDDDHEEEREHEHPRRIEVVFLRDHHAGVAIYWPRRIERLTLEGDDRDEFLPELSEHTGLSVKFLRVRVKVKHEDD